MPYAAPGDRYTMQAMCLMESAVAYTRDVMAPMQMRLECLHKRAIRRPLSSDIKVSESDMREFLAAKNREIWFTRIVDPANLPTVDSPSTMWFENELMRRMWCASATPWIVPNWVESDARGFIPHRCVLYESVEVERIGVVLGYFTGKLETNPLICPTPVPKEGELTLEPFLNRRPLQIPDENCSHKFRQVDSVAHIWNVLVLEDCRRIYADPCGGPIFGKSKRSYFFEHDDDYHIIDTQFMDCFAAMDKFNKTIAEVTNNERRNE